MNNWLVLLSDSLVIAGALILTLSIIPIWELFQQLPKGKLKLQWGFLISLVLLFIAGYLVYWRQTQTVSITPEALTVPVIFFCGSIFVFIINHLSLRTAKDVMQIYILKRQSITDPLLGIFNRRYLEECLKKEVLQSQRNKHPLSLFIIDIDHFKKVNDTWGHQVGDQALKHIAELIKTSVREYDIVARFGGEELVVILPKTEPSHSHQLAERLRSLIEARPIYLTNHHSGNTCSVNITASIGVTGLTKSNSFQDDLIESADKALYRAKQGGRNLVILNDDLELFF